MIRKIKALAVIAGCMIAGAYLLNLIITGFAYLLLFYYSL